MNTGRTKWEGDIAYLLTQMLFITNGDAQGLIDARSFKMTQWWARGITAHAVAHNIANDTVGGTT